MSYSVLQQQKPYFLRRGQPH